MIQPSSIDDLRKQALITFTNAERYEWTTMGFGMLRTYLDEDKRWRLNVWDDRLAVKNVSLIHDHPWSFTSWIFSGLLVNERFFEVSRTVPPFSHEFHLIKTGEDGGPVEAPQKVSLMPYTPEIYGRGATYHQDFNEIHRTTASRGAVSLNDRTPPNEAHTARVFWTLGNRWVDAKPRVATREEIERTLAGVDMYDLRVAG